MKPVFLVLVVVFGGCLSQPVEQPAGQVILSAENSPGSWVPSGAEVAKFESQLAKIFAKPDQRFVREKAQLSEYMVRYYGALSENRKVIIAEGTHVSEMDVATFRQKNSSPDTVLLPPSGGGRRHFTAVYDAAENQITAVRFNAPL